MKLIFATIMVLALAACNGNNSTASSKSAALTAQGQAPALTAAMTYNLEGDGGFDLAAMKGNVVLVDFWATWCGPCVKSIPELKAWHEHYNERGLRVVGFTDKSSRGLDSFIEEHEIPYTIAVSESMGNNDYGISSIPHLVLIDHEGKILKRGHPMSFDDADIESALVAAGL